MSSKVKCPHCLYGEWDVDQPLIAFCRRRGTFMYVEPYSAAAWVFIHDINNDVPMDIATTRFWNIIRGPKQNNRPPRRYIRILHPESIDDEGIS